MPRSGPSYKINWGFSAQPVPLGSAGNNQNSSSLMSSNSSPLASRVVTEHSRPAPSLQRSAEGSSNSKRSNPSRRLSDAEFQAKIAKGLCFRCDEKSTPNHHCKNRQLQVLLVADGDEDKVSQMEDPVSEQPELDLSLCELSLQSWNWVS